MLNVHSKALITEIFEMLVQFLEFAKLFSWEHHNTVIALPVKIDRHISSWKKDWISRQGGGFGSSHKLFYDIFMLSSFLPIAFFWAVNATMIQI